MSIIFSQNNGQNASRLNKTQFGLEDKLQEYIFNNPEAIPLYDIKEDIKLLILAREFSTESGPIDALGIDQDGQLYLIETKLYKNPDKRTVVAQVLDYGASLWKHLNDFDVFLMQLSQHTQKQFNLSAGEKIKEYFELSDDEMNKIWEQMHYNLDEGNFKFVVLMDGLHDRLKDLIVYMNQNSKFDIYGVELEYYKHESYEIIIPKIYGAQVKKDLLVPKSNSSRKELSNEQLIELFEKTNYASVFKQMLTLSRKINSGELKIRGMESHRTKQGIIFNFYSDNDNRVISFSLGMERGQVRDTMDIWCGKRTDLESEIVQIVENSLNVTLKTLDPNLKNGLIGKVELSCIIYEDLVQLLHELGQVSNVDSN